MNKELQQWERVANRLPPKGEVVETKISDHKGDRWRPKTQPR